MGYGDDESDPRINTLLALLSSDMEHRILKSVLADLSPEGKAKLEAAVVARVVKSLESETDTAVRDIVRQWVGNHAAEHTKKSWPPAVAKIEKRIAAHIDALLASDFVDKTIDEYAKPALRDSIRSVINGLVTAFRTGRT